MRTEGQILGGDGAGRQVLAYAGLMSRVIAAAIDALVMLLIFSPFWLVARRFDLGGFGGFLFLSIWCSWWAYASLMEAGRWQATIGKWVMGLIVTDLEGRPISVWRATGRFFGKVLTIYTLLFFYFGAISASRRKRALHDWLSGCVVLDRDSGALMGKDLQC